MYFLVILQALFWVQTSAWLNARSKEGCPEPIDIKPCVCYNNPFTSLECQHIDDSYVLSDVFKRSARYEFTEVHIKYSVLQFLPKDLFEKVKVSKLYLKNVTLVQLFDKPPQSLDNLDTLHIENTKVFRGMAWNLLQEFSNLRVLNVYFNTIKTLGPDFSNHVPKELKQINFYETGTKDIKPGTFQSFINLEKVALESCKLTSLSREIFPKPFNVRYLLFNGNKLSSIPDDLFSDMPNLQTVGLRHNEISVIPESAFQGSIKNLEYLQLDGNPITCDCQMKWLIQNKPPALSGKCDSPSEVKDTELRVLKPDSLLC